MLIITHPTASWPGVLCRVVRETANRLYVEVIGDVPSYKRSHVSGGYRGRPAYVERANVLYTNVTEAQYRRYIEAYDHYERELAEAANRLGEEFKQTLAAVFGNDS